MCRSCWLSTTLEGVQGGEQKWSALCLGKNWQDKSWDSCTLPASKSYYTVLFTYLYGTVSQLSEVLSPELHSSFLPQVKKQTNHDVSAASSVLRWQLRWPWQKDPEWASLLCLRSRRDWSLGTGTAPLHLYTSSESKQIGKSLLVLGSPVLVGDSEFYMIVKQLHAPSQLKDIFWGRSWLKDTKEYPPSWKTGEGLVERYQNLLSCRRLSGLCWVVREDGLMLLQGTSSNRKSASI